MIQQSLALIIITIFISRLFWQKKKKLVSANEFIFWLIFWLLSGVAILSLKWIDKVVAGLGFSSQGIDVLLYLVIIVLVYLIFRVRIKLERLDQDITKIVREISLKNKK
jgi:hypothetical protein